MMNTEVSFSTQTGGLADDTRRIHGDAIAPERGGMALGIEEVEPWPDVVEGKALLNELRDLIKRYVVLPPWGPEALALWVAHTYAFELRDVTTYLGISSPEKRCGKSTLLELLQMLANRALSAANISPSALFRVVEEARPTLLIDEADTFLHGNEEMRGILNSGYARNLAYVIRVANQAAPGVRSLDSRSGESGSGLWRFSCWCPKAMAAIGRFPETLMDRCVFITMQRKRPDERCERLRNLDGTVLRRKCARFVRDHAREIANVRPEVPGQLHDRAADIWEPLLALADLAGGEWPGLAREASVNLSAQGQEDRAIGRLLLGILVCFMGLQVPRIFSRDVVAQLNQLSDRPWAEAKNEKPLTDQMLAHLLRPYGIRPKTIWIGKVAGKGYLRADFEQAFGRYISRNDIDAMSATVRPVPETEGEKAESQSAETGGEPREGQAAKEAPQAAP